MDTVTLTVTGMTCGGCENAVKRALGRLDGVGDVQASHAEKNVTVVHDPSKVSPAQIRERISACGYTVVD